MDRLAFEKASDLEMAARKRCNEAVALASKARRNALDAAHRERDAGFDQLRDLRDTLADATEAMQAWGRNPPAVDTSAAEAEFIRATRQADHTLDTELKSIRRRLAAGELNPAI